MVGGSNPLASTSALGCGPRSLHIARLGAVFSEGELETSTRDVRLATFAPDSKDWHLECPFCGSSIRIEACREVLDLRLFYA